MKEYLEDRKIDKKHMKFHEFICFTFVSVFLIIIFLVGLLIESEEYIAAVILIAILILFIAVVVMIDEKQRKKYNKLYKQRKAYYVFDLNKQYGYNDLVLLLDNIRRKKEKMYIKHENEMIFRLKYGFVHDYIYRINAIKYDDFIEEEYHKKVIKLNKEYTDKFGTDEDNYRSRGNYSYGLHRINFIHSKELNKELEKVISKNAYYYLNTGMTSQTIVIVGDKMYVPSIRTNPGGEIIKHTITLNNIFKYFGIKAS